MKSKARPRLIAADGDMVHCFDAAIHNTVDINTVRCCYRRYNKTGLLKHRYMLRAGGCYKTPWTRDASINTWQAMNFISPEVSRTTLLAVCEPNEKGEIIIQPDTQVWDQIIWSVGAYNYYLTTGDEEFLTVAYGVIGRALDFHRKNRFNSEYGLFRGGSFFNDGIAGYPLRCHQKGLNKSFAPSHQLVEEIMCLSTNCLYCAAYRIYAELSLKLDALSEAHSAHIYHQELKDAVNRHFYSEDTGRYRYIIYPDGSTDDSQELSGNSFAVLFGICPEGMRKTLLKSLTLSDSGAVSIFPPFEGLFSHSKPGRHNNVIWPFLNGMLIEAMCRCGLYGMAGDELKRLTELFKGSKFRLFEIYSPYTKKPYGGWQTGREWDSCRHQTWTATCYIGALIHGVFGIKAEEKGISISPCAPELLKDSELCGIRLRGNELSVKLTGYGNRIEKFFLDGKECEPFIPWDGKAHKAEIALSEK